MSLLAFSWYVSGREAVPLGRHGVQTRRSWAKRGSPGMFYFGAVLGTGIATELSTPLAVLPMATSFAWGTTIAWPVALGFGLGRAFPAIFGMGLSKSPGEVARFFVGNRARLRTPGTVVSVAAIVFFAAELMRSV
jgi:hypothetical protein